MKWLGVILLVILGALATYVAVEYFTVAIHALPSYFPGHKVTSPGHPRGHYRKRGALAAVVAAASFAVAGYLTYRNLRTPKEAPAVEAPSDSIL